MILRRNVLGWLTWLEARQAHNGHRYTGGRGKPGAAVQKAGSLRTRGTRMQPPSRAGDLKAQRVPGGSPCSRAQEKQNVCSYASFVFLQLVFHLGPSLLGGTSKFRAVSPSDWLTTCQSSPETPSQTCRKCGFPVFQVSVKIIKLTTKIIITISEGKAGRMQRNGEQQNNTVVGDK